MGSKIVQRILIDLAENCLAVCSICGWTELQYIYLHQKTELSDVCQSNLWSLDCNDVTFDAFFCFVFTIYFSQMSLELWKV